MYEPPSTFTICYDGAPQDDVVTGRPVYFELLPTAGSAMFDFRLRGQSTAWSPTGLRAWQDDVRALTYALRGLESSSEPIAKLTVTKDALSTPASALAPLETARARYLGFVTSDYLQSLKEAREQAKDLPVVASVARRWCGELSEGAGATLPQGPELRARCAGEELKEGVVEHEVETFEAAAAKFQSARMLAREATLTAVARPEDDGAVSAAVRSLDGAREAAVATLGGARALEARSSALGHDVAALRGAVRSAGALRPGAPVYLATYATAGNAELEIDVTPVDIGSAGEDAARADAGKTTARFPIVGRHYVDLEAGLGFTAGLPPLPALLTQGGATTVQGKPVDEFVGLGLIELEPARFLWPDQPLAGLLRLPVLGVPFTRDPTQNFFFGAGLGWSGVGSVTAGPYLLRELTLKSGLATGDALPAGTSLDAATDPVLQVGYFVSASVDLLGLFHVFFPERTQVVEGTTGKEK